jgi:hypothetical protein
LPNPFQIGRKYLKQNNYITPIFELKSQEAKYLASPLWKTSYLEMMILMQSFVGPRRSGRACRVDESFSISGV